MVGAADLHAMPGIIHHRPVGLFGLIGEGAQAVDQFFARGIVGERHLVEPDIAQRRRDRLGVLLRIRKHRYVLVGGIADHQRDAAPLLGDGRLDRGSRHGRSGNGRRRDRCRRYCLGQGDGN